VLENQAGGLINLCSAYLRFYIFSFALARPIRVP
jgi:hypothetical protein